MPGIIQEGERNSIRDGRAYRPQVAKGNNPSGWDNTTPWSGSGGESYRVPYPFQTTTTPYGLNEPQWSFGPPPLIYELSPYSRVPLPPLFRMNPLLAFDENPAITWLIDKHPQYAMPTPGKSVVDVYHWKSMPATDPTNSKSLKICIERFGSLITVHPTDGVITIGDVLLAVYTGARRNATEAFCQQLAVDPRIMMGREIRDYGRLVTQGVGPPVGDDEVSSNVRGEMNFRTRWAGLTPSRREQDVWVLHTMPLAG